MSERGICTIADCSKSTGGALARFGIRRACGWGINGSWHTDKGNAKRNRHDAHADVPTQGELVVQQKRPPGFQRGHKKYGGRKPGTPNKVNKAMHEWMDQATTLFGYDGSGRGGMVDFFLSRIDENRHLFLKVMAKLQPRVLQPAVEQRPAVNMTYETVEQAKEALAREGIIIDRDLRRTRRARHDCPETDHDGLAPARRRMNSKTNAVASSGE